MKKYIIIFTVGILFMFGLVVVEGFYISKCKTRISQLENLNKDLDSANYELKNLNRELKDKNDDLKSTQEEKHPIEIRLQECMKRQNYTTAAMNSCTYSATDEWQKEIDTNIVLLKNHMTKQQYTLLMDSQDKWKTYEIAERKLLDATVGEFVGSMYTTVLAGDKLDIVETRARNLSGLYYYMTDEYVMKQ